MLNKDGTVAVSVWLPNYCWPWTQLLKGENSCLKVYLTTSQAWEYQLTVFRKIVYIMKKKFCNFNFVMNRFAYLVHTKHGGSDVWNSHWNLFHSRPIFHVHLRLWMIASNFWYTFYHLFNPKIITNTMGNKVL